MEVKVENYRGWDISFDTSTEGFFVESDRWDERKEKRSFAACKSFVDQYLKDNSEFKPIRIHHKSSGGEILLTGIRKDGRFTYENKGKKTQLSEYDEKDYILFNADNLPIFAEAKRLKEDASELRRKADALIDTITGKPLVELKKELYPK